MESFLYGETYGLYADNAMDFRSLLGKTAEEAELPDEVIQGSIDSGCFDVCLAGNLMGEELEGVMYADNGDSDGEPVIKTVQLYVYDTDYEYLSAELEGIYGTAAASGMEPYAEANGGSVKWEEYTDSGETARISSGSKNDWYTLEFSLNE